jgi:hypothetical protein
MEQRLGRQEPPRAARRRLCDAVVVHASGIGVAVTPRENNRVADGLVDGACL